VGLLNVTLFTVTPPPLILAEMRLGNPEPGSKNSEPETEVPVITILTPLDPMGTEGGFALEGVAGGGALSWTTWIPQEFVALQYSCTVHIVMSSLGSTEVNE